MKIKPDIFLNVLKRFLISINQMP